VSTTKPVIFLRGNSPPDCSVLPISWGQNDLKDTSFDWRSAIWLVVVEPGNIDTRSGTPCMPRPGRSTPPCNRKAHSRSLPHHADSIRTHAATHSTATGRWLGGI